MKPDSPRGASPKPSRLARELAPRVVELARQQGLAPGARLTEQALARSLQVSRTPVRAALEALAAEGIVARRQAGGYELRRLRAPKPPAAPDPPDAVEVLCLRIGRERAAGILPAEVSEADLMRRYGASRPLLMRVLERLAEVALAERKPGHGWILAETRRDLRLRAESYAFRLLIEPAALMSADFALPGGWIEQMRRQHEAILAAPWTETLAIPLFEMNAAFHEGITAASGNRFLAFAQQQQTRLRRFGNYDWAWGHDRVVVSCTEHLEILEQLARGARDVAAVLMRRHIARAAALQHIEPPPLP